MRREGPGEGNAADLGTGCVAGLCTLEATALSEEPLEGCELFYPGEKPK